MNVIVSLRNASVYEVRFQVFLELSAYVNQVTLLTDELDDSLRDRAHSFPKLRVVELGREAFGLHSERWLSEHVVHVTTPTIVHSTFGHLVRFFETYGNDSPRQFRLVHTQYTANHDWFRTTRFQDYPMSYRYLGQRVKSFWNDRRMADSADAVFVVCPAHKDGLIRAHGMDPDKIYPVPSEVDSDFYQNCRPVRQGTRKLLFVGACYKNKGLDVLFQALPAIFESEPMLEVELYGRTVQRQESWFMKKLAEVRTYGRVLMKGTVDRTRLRDAFFQADALISPSRFEGSPRAVREALAGGCPCILSDIPGHHGLDVKRNYVSFVNGFEPSLWSQAVIRHLAQDNQEWLRRAKAGVDAMVDSHAPQAVAQYLSKTYEGLFRTSL